MHQIRKISETVWLYAIFIFCLVLFSGQKSKMYKCLHSHIHFSVCSKCSGLLILKGFTTSAGAIYLSAERSENVTAALMVIKI